MASEEIWILSITCLSELVVADPYTTIINEVAAVSPACDIFRHLFLYVPLMSNSDDLFIGRA
jgi:hypothetical protein